MRRVRSFLSIAAVAAAIALPAGSASAATITFDTTLSGPGWYNGDPSNPEGGFTVASGDGVEIGLRVKHRADINAIHSADNIYEVPAGSQSPSVTTRAWWNHEWSIYLDPTGQLTLNDILPYSTYTVSDLTAGVTRTVSFVPPDMPCDSSYWTPNTVTNGSIANACGSSLWTSHYGVQNSGNPVFGDFPLNPLPGYEFDMNAEHYYRITLDVRTANGSLATNTIDVRVGNAAVPAPEPATLALMSMGLVGLVARRRRMNGR